MGIFIEIHFIVYYNHTNIHKEKAKKKRKKYENISGYFKKLS